MAKYNIWVYAISKNEEKFVDRWMDAVSEADRVVVVDTGSTDKTVEKLKARGALVYEHHIEPWRFDVARNIAMDYIPNHVDICVANDLDEIFEKNWREKLEAAWEEDCTRARYWFVWGRKADGTPEKRFGMEKIHRREGFRWMHPVHEVLVYHGEMKEKSVFISSITLHHYPDPQKTRSHYLPLLELSAQENPEDDRTMFWLGREYIFNRRYEQGILTLKKHLQLPSAVWEEERCASMRFISRGYQSLGNAKEGLQWLYRAVGECPSVREPWWDLASIAYQIQNWELVLFSAVKGLEIKHCTESYLVEPAAWQYGFDDYASIACYWLGHYVKAQEYALKSIIMAPDNERLQQNLRLIQQQL